MNIIVALLVLTLGVVIWMWQREIASHKKTLNVCEAKMDDYLEKIFQQHGDLAEKDREYEALDQGMREQEDAYEQDFLTFKENIEVWKDRVTHMELLLATLRMVRSHHYDTCLPQLDEIVPFIAFSENLYEETPIFDEMVVTAG